MVSDSWVKKKPRVLLFKSADVTVTRKPKLHTRRRMSEGVIEDVKGERARGGGGEGGGEKRGGTGGARGRGEVAKERGTQRRRRRINEGMEEIWEGKVKLKEVVAKVEKATEVQEEVKKGEWRKEGR